MINKPQYPTTREIYRKSNGDQVVQSIVVRKTYEGITDYISDRLHGRIQIMLAHDFLQIETDNYYGKLSQSGDYQIQWLTFKNLPIAQSKFQVEVNPFDATNSNCQTCADATQIITNDDSFYPDLNEDTDYSLDVKANDEICCFPVTFSIITFDTDYLSSAIIDVDGVIHIHTKTGLTAINQLNLLTYRATCPNGNYDEADVFANINGSVAGCLAPREVDVYAMTTTSASIEWTPPSPLPNHYHYKLWNDVTHVFDQEGDLPNTDVNHVYTGLTPGNDYIFYIRSACAVGNDDADSSNYIQVSFTTPPVSDLCGEYTVGLNDPSLPGPSSGGHVNVSYTDCTGNNVVLYVPNMITRPICAMQTGPGSPTYIATGGNPFVTVTYIGPCPP